MIVNPTKQVLVQEADSYEISALCHFTNLNNTYAGVTTSALITDLVSSVYILSANINTISGDLYQLSSEVSGYALQTDVNTISGDLNTLQTNFLNVSSDLYTLSGSLSNYILSGSLSGYATNNSLSSYATDSSLSSYATNNSLSSYATESSLSGYALQSEFVTVSSDLYTLSAYTHSISGADIGTLSGDLYSLSADFLSVSSDLYDLSSYVQTLSGGGGGVSGDYITASGDTVASATFTYNNSDIKLTNGGSMSFAGAGYLSGVSTTQKWYNGQITLGQEIIPGLLYNDYILLDGSTGYIKLIDNIKLYFGSSNDSSIWYNGTNLNIDPNLVGNGKVNVLGNIDVNSNQLQWGSPAIAMSADVGGTNDFDMKLGGLATIKATGINFEVQNFNQHFKFNSYVDLTDMVGASGGLIVEHIYRTSGTYILSAGTDNIMYAPSMSIGAISGADDSALATKGYVDTIATGGSLSGYATIGSLSAYATESSLSGYATTGSLSSYATGTSLSAYTTESSLSGYALQSEFVTVSSDLYTLSASIGGVTASISVTGTLPVTPLNIFYELSASTDVYPTGYYLHDGIGWTCIQQNGAISISSSSSALSTTLVPGVVYDLSATENITTLDIDLETYGSVIINTYNSGGYTISNPVSGADIFKRGASGTNALSDVNAEIVVSKSNKGRTYSTVGLESI